MPHFLFTGALWGFCIAPTDDLTRVSGHWAHLACQKQNRVCQEFTMLSDRFGYTKFSCIFAMRGQYGFDLSCVCVCLYKYVHPHTDYHHVLVSDGLLTCCYWAVWCLRAQYIFMLTVVWVQMDVCVFLVEIVFNVSLFISNIKMPLMAYFHRAVRFSSVQYSMIWDWEPWSGVVDPLPDCGRG